MTESTTGTVIVKRRTWIQDLARRYSVLIDGEDVGHVSAFRTAEFPIDPGSHRVRLVIPGTGRASSGDIDINVAAGSPVVLRTTGRGIKSMLLLPFSFPAGAKAQATGQQYRFYKGPWIKVRVER